MTLKAGLVCVGTSDDTQYVFSIPENITTTVNNGIAHFGTASEPIKVYQGMYLGCVVLGAVSSLGNVIDFSDMMILSCGFPNVIGCLFLLPLLNEKLKDYWTRFQSGSFKVYK